MIKWLVRLALFPVLIILTLLEWCGTYIVHYSGMLCRLISGTIFTLVIVGFVTGLGNGEQLTKMFVVGLVINFAPWIGAFIIGRITFAYTVLIDLISD